MRPAFLVMFAGFAMASSLWAARANASTCAVDTDCLDDGLACGTDVCGKTGTCVPAGSDPGTCNSQSNCKCYGLLSVLCDPQTHSCTMTSADGGVNSGGGATSGGGAASGGGGVSGGGGSSGVGASGTTGSGGSGTTSEMDAGSSQATSGSTVATSGSTVDVSGTVTGGPGTGSYSSGGASVGGPTVGGSGAATSGNTGGSGASAGSTENSPKASKSGCTVGFGDEPMPAGMLGIGVGAWLLLGRRWGRRL